MKIYLFFILNFFNYLSNSYSNLLNTKDFSYKMKAGDTIFHIAQICRVKTAELMSYNKLDNSSIIKINQEIKIPSIYYPNCKNELEKKDEKILPKKEEIVKNVNIAKKEDKPVIKNQDINNSVSSSENKEVKKTETKEVKIKNEQKKQDKCFLFKIKQKPMEGEMFDTFGTDSIYSSGIIIKTEKDSTAVKAVDDGKVIFKGKNIPINKDSSKILIISHKDNYFTGYGIDSEEIFVKEGDRVKQGQIIANLDLTKDSSLFFTIRTKDGLICNPLEFLRAIK